MMSHFQALDRAVRLFVAEPFDPNSHLDANAAALAADLGISKLLVVPGNETLPRDKKTYASVLLVSNERMAHPVYRQLDNGRTVYSVLRKAVYSIQFYRKGADYLAEQFDLWCMSENGLTYAENAFSDGRIIEIVVLDGGSGYEEGSTHIAIIGDGINARAEARVVNGRVSRVRMLDFGSGYSLQPEISFTGVGTGAKASARGSGFVIKQPSNIRRLDAMIADMYEERSQIDLEVHYNFSQIQSTGNITSNTGELCLDGEDPVQIQGSLR